MPEYQCAVETVDRLYETLAPTTLFVTTRRAPDLGSRVRVRVVHEGVDLLVVDGDVGWVYPARALPARRRAGFGIVIKRVEPGFSAAMNEYSQRGVEAFAEPPGARLLPFRLPTRDTPPEPAPSVTASIPAVTASRPLPASKPKKPPRKLPPAENIIDDQPLPGLRAVAYTVYPEDDEAPDSRVRPLSWPHALETPTVELTVSGAPPPSEDAPAQVTANTPKTAAIVPTPDDNEATANADDAPDAPVHPPKNLLVDETSQPQPPARALELLGDDLDDEETEIDHEQNPPIAADEDDEDPSLTIPGFDIDEDRTLVDVPSAESLIPSDAPSDAGDEPSEGPLLPDTVWLGIYGREPLRLFERGVSLPADARYQLLLPEVGDIELRFFEGESDGLRRVGVGRWSRRVFEQDAQLKFSVDRDGVVSAQHDEVSSPQRFYLSWSEKPANEAASSLFGTIKKLFGR